MSSSVPLVLAPSSRIFARRGYCVITENTKLKCTVMHPSEAFVLSLLDGHRGKEEIAAVFGNVFGVSPDESIETTRVVIEKFTAYLCAFDGRGELGRRYDPESFIYPGFTDPPGLTEPMEGPLYLTLVLGNRCNFACVYCYADLSASPMSISGPEAVCLIEEAAAMGAVSVCLTGGEPLLHPDLDAIIGAADRKGMIVVLATNGSMVDESMAERLKQSGLKAVQVSLDAPSAEMHHSLTGSTDTFESVLTGIAFLKRKGLRVTTRSVIMADNVRSVPALIDLLRDSCVDEITLTTRIVCSGTFNRTAEGRLDREALEFLNRVIAEKSAQYPDCAILFTQRERDWRSGEDIVPCGGPMSALVVHPSGDVNFCEMMPDIPEMSLGNFRHESIRNMWRGARHQQFLRDTVSTQRVDPACGNCTSLDECRTGCYSLSRSLSHDCYARDPRCPGPEELGRTITKDRLARP